MRKCLGKRAGALCSAAAIVTSAMASHAMATNLLENPGFESPSSTTNPNSVVTGWTLYGSELRANYQNNTPGGQWSMWEQTFNPYGGVYQVVGNVQAGTNYTLSAYEYAEANYGTTGATSDMELTWYGPGTVGAGATEEGSPSQLLIPSNIATGVWTQYTLTNALAPTGATQVLVSFDFTSTTQTGGALALFTDDADLEGVGIAYNTAAWALNSSGDWNVSGNWTTGSVPNGAGIEADFFNAPSSNTTVYTNTTDTAGFLHFNNAFEYEITGTGALTLQAATGSATVQVDQNKAILDLPITLASNTVFNVAANATLVVANPITINAGKTLTQTGAGTVTYQSIITALSGSSVVFADSTHAHELDLSSGATATVSAPQLELDNLGNSSGGTVNIQNNMVIINYGSGPDPISSIAAQILSGFNHGSWTGTGITSTNAQTNSGSYGIGYADAADPGNPAGLSSGQIEIFYTLLGDANLDGKVNGTDFTLMATNFNDAVTNGWDKGDFDYSGAVNGSDFLLLAKNFNQFASQSSVSASDEAALDSFAAANGISLASVPEPASVGLLALGIVSGLARRRRKS